jgi:hypothetical protein
MLNSQIYFWYIHNAKCIQKNMKNKTAAINLIVLVALTFTSCSLLHKGSLRAKNWNGSDVPGHNYATFDLLSGTQKFDLKLSKKGTFYFKYATDIKAGKLHLSVESPTRTILSKDLHGPQADSILVDNPASETFQIILVGSRAAGKVDFKYGNL